MCKLFSKVSSSLRVNNSAIKLFMTPIFLWNPLIQLPCSFLKIPPLYDNHELTITEHFMFNFIHPQGRGIPSYLQDNQILHSLTSQHHAKFLGLFQNLNMDVWGFLTYLNWNGFIFFQIWHIIQVSTTYQSILVCCIEGLT